MLSSMSLSENHTNTIQPLHSTTESSHPHQQQQRQHSHPEKILQIHRRRIGGSMVMPHALRLKHSPRCWLVSMSTTTAMSKTRTAPTLKREASTGTMRKIANPVAHRMILRCDLSMSRWRVFLLTTMLIVFQQQAQRRVVAAAPEVHARNCGGHVHHVHLAVGGQDPARTMTVSFASIISSYAEAPVAGVVVGRIPGEWDRIVWEQQDTIDNNDVPVWDSHSPTHYHLQTPAPHANIQDRQGRYWYYSPYYHHVRVDQLEPATTYYYKPVLGATRQDLQDLFDTASLSGTDVEIRDPQQQQQQPHDHRSQNTSAHATRVKAMMASEATRKSHNNETTTKERYKEQPGRRTRHGYGRHFRRGLIGLLPYDGTHRACPSPDKLRSFRTAPERGSDDTITLAVVGDLGQFEHSEETMASLLQTCTTMQVDAVILAGDIAYTSDDHRRWDTFFDFFDDYPVAESKPMQICPGNHDIDKQHYNYSREIFLSYEYRFRMPQVHPPELGLYEGDSVELNMDTPPYPLPYEWGNAFYSFPYGQVYVIMLSAYSPMEPDSAQYQWLLSELRQVDRDVTPWLLAVIHTPMYNTFGVHHHDVQIVVAKQHFEPLLVEYKANVVFTGHIHAYSRSKPVAFDEVQPDGPVHITVGAGGRKCEAPFTQTTPESWVEVRDATMYGHGLFTMYNATVAQWDWVHTGTADDRTYNQVWHSNLTLPAGPGRDQVWLYNQYFFKKEEKKNELL